MTSARKQRWPGLMKALDIDVKAATRLNQLVTAQTSGYGSRPQTRDDLLALKRSVHLALLHLSAVDNLLNTVTDPTYDLDAFEARIRDLRTKARSAWLRS